VKDDIQNGQGRSKSSVGTKTRKLGMSRRSSNERGVLFVRASSDDDDEVVLEEKKKKKKNSDLLRDFLRMAKEIDVKKKLSALPDDVMRLVNGVKKSIEKRNNSTAKTYVGNDLYDYGDTLSDGVVD